MLICRRSSENLLIDKSCRIASNFIRDDFLDRRKSQFIWIMNILRTQWIPFYRITSHRPRSEPTSRVMWRRRQQFAMYISQKAKTQARTNLHSDKNKKKAYETKKNSAATESNATCPISCSGRYRHDVCGGSFCNFQPFADFSQDTFPIVGPYRPNKYIRHGSSEKENCHLTGVLGGRRRCHCQICSPRLISFQSCHRTCGTWSSKRIQSYGKEKTHGWPLSKAWWMVSHRFPKPGNTHLIVHRGENRCRK